MSGNCVSPNNVFGQLLIRYIIDKKIENVLTLIMRTFVAIDLSMDFKHKIHENILNIEENHKDYKWVYKENSHITLSFFNNLDETGFKLLVCAIEDAVKNIKGFVFTTDKIIYIPIGIHREGDYTYQKRMNGLALSIDKGKDKIKKIYETIENKLIEEGFKNNYQFRQKERREYIPHITIARKGRKPMMYALAHEIMVSLEGNVDNITIFKSDLFKGNPNRQHKETSKYTKLKIYSLDC